MNLADFTYWTSLNESQKSYYTFEIPNRSLSELDEEYITVLNEILNENSNLFSYEIAPNTSKLGSDGRITVSFKSEKDELLSAIYGDTLDFAIELVMPGKSSFSTGKWKIIRPEMLYRVMKTAIWQSTSKVVNGTLEIVTVIIPSELDNKIISVAKSVNGMYNIPKKPDASDFSKAQTHAINNKLGNHSDSVIEDLTDKLNEYVRYASTVRVLHRFIKSTSTPNLEEVKTSFKNRLAKVKSLDPANEEDFKEILSFQKDLLSKADVNKLENPVTTDSLIEVFRIVLNKLDTVKDIKKELDKITD